MNMMTKYQMVYLRLEASLKNIIQNKEARMRMRLKRSFQAFKTNAFELSKVDQIRKKKVLVYTKVELVLGSMIKAVTRYQQRTVLS